MGFSPGHDAAIEQTRGCLPVLLGTLIVGGILGGLIWVGNTYGPPPASDQIDPAMKTQQSIAWAGTAGELVPVCLDLDATFSPDTCDSLAAQGRLFWMSGAYKIKLLDSYQPEIIGQPTPYLVYKIKVLEGHHKGKTGYLWASYIVTKQPAQY